VIKPKETIKADTWLKENFEDTVEKYAGRYVVIVDNHGIVFTNKDGKPRKIVNKAKRKYPKSAPLFFRVPHPDELGSLCVPKTGS